MPFLSGDVILKQVTDTHFDLLEGLAYAGREQTFHVPAGFRTDLASVPRIFFWLFPSYGAYTKAAILHDYLCETKLVSRADADGLFRRTMRELEVPFLRRWMMWAGVRVGARFSGIKFGDLLIWLLVALPTAVFLLLPTVTILAVLVMLWMVELIAYVLLMLFARRKPKAPPHLWPPAQSQK